MSIMFEGMLTEIQQTSESEAPVATFFGWSHCLRIFLCGVEMQFVQFWLSSNRAHAFRCMDRDLPSDQNKLLGDIGSTSKQVLDLLTRCEHVEKMQLDGVQCEITEVCSELERLERVSRDQKQAIAYKMDKASEQLRKEYISQKLASGGFGLKHSKFSGESMFNIMEKEPEGGTPIGADVSGRRRSTARRSSSGLRMLVGSRCKISFNGTPTR